MPTRDLVGAELAEGLRVANLGAIREAGRRVLELRPDNLVERPWGGQALFDFKGLQARRDGQSVQIGESFEISAYPADPESAAHPGSIVFRDEYEMPIGELLEVAGESILGSRHLEIFGATIPLLPKFLDVRELLSIQAHPPGHPEVYVVVEADSGATLQLGFRQGASIEEIGQAMRQGLDKQKLLLENLRSDRSEQDLHERLSAWLADRKQGVEEARESLEVVLQWHETMSETLVGLKRIFWSSLDLMNRIPLRSGQVLYNRQPTFSPTSATFHALGNPERRSALLLEIRRPGPTLRAWDNLRFPIRRTETAAAFDAVVREGTEAADFEVPIVPRGDEPGVSRSVENEFFAVDHLAPSLDDSLVSRSCDTLQTLHGVRGICLLRSEESDFETEIRAGHSALVPVGCGDLRIRAQSPQAEMVRVTLFLPDRP